MLFACRMPRLGLFLLVILTVLRRPPLQVRAGMPRPVL
jgi:hypothetical protein